MRRANPLHEILEAAMKREEPLLDTEWPAGDLLLAGAETPSEPQDGRQVRPAPVGLIRR